MRLIPHLKCALECHPQLPKEYTKLIIGRQKVNSPITIPFYRVPIHLSEETSDVACVLVCGRTEAIRTLGSQALCAGRAIT